MISTIAGLHFAPTSANLQNLARENIPVAQVFVTGNTGIDALHWASTMDVEFANPELQALHDSDSRIVVVTAHRRENWGDGLRGIADGIARLAARAPRRPFRPARASQPARARGADRVPRGLDNVLLTEPLGYATFSRLLAPRHLVITDSGGVQEEAPSLGKPVLVTRETTERTEGLAGRHAAPGRHRPGADLRRGRRACSATRSPTREMAEARKPLRRRPRRRADRRRARAPPPRRRAAEPVRPRLQPLGGRRRPPASSRSPTTTAHARVALGDAGLAPRQLARGRERSSSSE